MAGQEQVTKDPVTKELQRLRRVQAKYVMPLIGPLLDAWEQVPSDIACSDELEELSVAIEAINDAMECEE